MDTIEEQTKSDSDVSSNEPTPPPKPIVKTRICLVGDVCNDPDTVQAAQSFGAYVVLSENGLEYASDLEWRTHFILKDFEGPIFDEIHRNKQCILGPPALKQAAALHDGLPHNLRPLYNYSMRGVITCFTGIRRKEELTNLVNLIHSMGGTIRKEMTSKITHLISYHSGGDKYRYAKTFRLTVVRPAWVYAAWEQRNDETFRATTDDFTVCHKLKAFEGLKICFFGFPCEEHQHMVDVLTANGGVPTELDDPECSHVVMPNSDGYCSESFVNTNNDNNLEKEMDAEVATAINYGTTTSTSTLPNDIDTCISSKLLEIKQIQIQENHYDNDDNDNINGSHFDERLVIDNKSLNDFNNTSIQSKLINFNDDLKDIEKDLTCSSPTDGIVLKASEECDFQQKFCISPILNTNDLNNCHQEIINNQNDFHQVNATIKENEDDNIIINEDDDNDNDNDNDDDDNDRNNRKRRRDPSDSNSFIDSSLLIESTKKLKLARTGSISRSIRRSMSFVASRTPIGKILKPRRNSESVDTSLVDMTQMNTTQISNSGILTNEADLSKSSLNLDNDSISRPVKDKLHCIRDKIIKSGFKKEKFNINTKKTPKRFTKILTDKSDNNPIMNDVFKTPKALKKSSSLFGNTKAADIPSNTTNLINTTFLSSTKEETEEQLLTSEYISNDNKKGRKDVYGGADGAGGGGDETVAVAAEASFSISLSPKAKTSKLKRTLSYSSPSSSTPSTSTSISTTSTSTSTSTTSSSSLSNINVNLPFSLSFSSDSNKTNIVTNTTNTNNHNHNHNHNNNTNIHNCINKKHLNSNSTTSTITTNLSSKSINPSLTDSDNQSTNSHPITNLNTKNDNKNANVNATINMNINMNINMSMNMNMNINASNREKLIANNIPNMPNGEDKAGASTSMKPSSLRNFNLTRNDENGRSTTVVDEHTVQAKPEPKSSRTHIIKSDWFWYTIQNGYAHETDYLFGDYLDSIACTPNTDRSDSLPLSFNNKRKRKRFSQRLQLEGTPLGSGKRRSSVSDAGLLSLSSSFFDCTTSPEKLEITVGETSTSDPSIKTMRFNHFMDFFTTESNYVGILDTIVNLFKNPLEQSAECNEALLNKSEIKAIFGNFVPIHEVHKKMLERLCLVQSHWTEESLIGDIILEHRDDLIKAYPPYVNFFEQMKETLLQCDEMYPRFHAFLKINQTKPECGRQSLEDLMIRPVQRLPSISLLLNGILKHTNKISPDYERLEEALKAIKEVMTYINEDKRKTESRMAIFDVFNDIDGCPAHLISSNRDYISKCEVTELSDSLSGRGDSLALYLFTDTIEICKKRSRGFNSAKSPCTAKCYKHLKLMSLNTIRFVIDITDSPKAFAILFRHDKDKLHSFAIADDEIEKKIYLRQLCKQIAENACRTDADRLLLYRTSQELDVDISDVHLSTLSKAFKLAARTRLKVGRAFSFNKTPSKLKRAVSTMMTSPFGTNGANSLTPATQLAQMRLASVANIHEAEDLTDDQEQILHT